MFPIHFQELDAFQNDETPRVIETLNKLTLSVNDIFQELKQSKQRRTSF